MKVILSRKGFDSQYGSQPSPILPDGTLLSFPIPQENDTQKFSNLFYNNKSYFQLIKELNPRNKLKEDSTAHLDPDIRRQIINRKIGWKPLFGQSGAAQGKLNNEQLKTGDIFLFFGWFKQTEINPNKPSEIRYKIGAPDLHIIYGYFQIDSIIKEKSLFPKYGNYHSHYDDRIRTNNCIYTCTDELTLISGLPGAGTLNYSEKLVLTKNGYSKSRWQLPEFFKDLKISYHSEKSFKKDYFQSVARGQEFAIQPDERLTKWLKNIIVQ